VPAGPALASWDGPDGRTQVVIDDTHTPADGVSDPLGCLGIPVTITVDGPTMTTGGDAGTAQAGDEAAAATVADRAPAEVVDLQAYRTHRHPAGAAMDEAGSHDTGSDIRAGLDTAEETAGAVAEDDDSYGL
jgi:hypothetical protein